MTTVHYLSFNETAYTGTFLEFFENYKSKTDSFDLFVIDDRPTNGGVVECYRIFHNNGEVRWEQISTNDYEQLKNTPNIATDERIVANMLHLGAYDTMVENSDGTYTITRQTGYHNISNDLIEHGYYRKTQGSHGEYGSDTGIHNLPIVSEQKNFINNLLEVRTTGDIYNGLTGIAITSNGGCWMNLGDNYNSKEKYVEYLSQNNIYIQYKLATSYTEKVEKNHYARYNERFILEHNKSEAERSANLWEFGDISVTSSSGETWKRTERDLTLEAGTYIINVTNNSEFNYILIANNYVTLVEGREKSYKFTLSNKSLVNFFFYATDDHATSRTVTYSNIMLNEGSVALPYQPYEGEVIHEKELKDNLSGYVDKTSNQVINGLKQFKDGIAFRRDDTGVFESDNTYNVEIKCFGQELFFKGKGGGNDYVCNASFIFDYSGQNNSIPYFFPTKSGTVALTSDLDPIKNDLVENEYNLGAYDTYIKNGDGTYTITRQTGYIKFDTRTWTKEIYTNITRYKINVGTEEFHSSMKKLTDPGDTVPTETGYCVYGPTIYVFAANNDFTNVNGYFQYKLATSYTEKVEKNHYARYNQRFILENNKKEAERSANIKDLNYNNTENGITLSIVNNKFTISGTNTRKEDLMGYSINLNPGTYTISTQNVSGTSSDNFRLVVHDNNWTYQRTVYFNANSYATFTVSPDITTPTIFTIYGPANGNTINCSGYIMLNEGTIALPYQPYNQNKHITNNEAVFLKTESDRSANLFDYGNAEWEHDVSLSTSVGNLFNRSGSKVSTFVTVEPNKTYSIQNCAVICFYNSNKEYLNIYKYINYYSVNNFSFATPSNCAYIRIDTEISITQIMLNEGSVALPYQPYEGEVVHDKVAVTTRKYNTHTRFYGTKVNAGAGFYNGGIEIREADLVDNANTDVLYAPRIGFHWSHVRASSLLMNKDGGFEFVNQSEDGYSPITFGGASSFGNLHIYASSGSYAEGIRIHPADNWDTITLCGTDNTGYSGTSALTWSIHNNDGKFYLTKNGRTQSYTNVSFSNTDGYWRLSANTDNHYSLAILGNGANEASIAYRGASGTEWVVGRGVAGGNDFGWRQSGNTVMSLNTSGDLTITGKLTASSVTNTGNIVCGNTTIYSSGSNGNVNSILIGDDVTLGDCNVPGHFGMKSTGETAGFRFFNSSGAILGTLTASMDNQNGLSFAGYKVAMADEASSGFVRTHGTPDLNSLRAYCFNGSTSSNTPDGSWCYVSSTSHRGGDVEDGATFTFQTVAGFWSNSIWYRKHNGSGWTDWSTFITSQNIGSQTVANANQLGSYSSSSYLREYAARMPYVPYGSIGGGYFTTISSSGRLQVTYQTIQISAGDNATTRVVFPRDFSSQPAVFVTEQYKSNTNSLTYRNNTTVQAVATDGCVLRSGKSEGPYVYILAIGNGGL